MADTSALVAVVLGEPAAEVMLHALTQSTDIVMSAVAKVEAGMVVEARRGAPGRHRLETLVAELAIEVVAVDATQAELALSAWRRFGKGRHAAGLNFGDCFGYALASSLGRPILFTGNDFRQTDLAVAV